MIPGVGLFDFFGLEVLNTLRLTGLASAMGESDRGSCDRWRGEEGPADCRSWSSSIIWVMTKLSLVQHGKSDRQVCSTGRTVSKEVDCEKFLKEHLGFWNLINTINTFLLLTTPHLLLPPSRMCLPDIFLYAFPLEIRSLT